MRNETDSLLCFDPPRTYVEYSKNRDRQIFITESSNRGYHCLFGHSVDENLIRLDRVTMLTKNEWIGQRTVHSILALPGGDVPIHSLKNRDVYFTYSPGLVNSGKGLKIKFRD